SLWPATTTSPQQLADRYTKEHLLHISQRMGGHPNDSLQLAANAYNDGQYNKALPLLDGLINNDSLNTAALNLSGRTYLMTKQFDKALLRFESLARKKGSFSNPGKFLQAVTLLQRNRTGDVLHAKQLLQ
ncbi:MAG TPA: hypothetical protein VN824_00915, partial [Puia sp.]|nr:hypothetical protein [Puia sp.]